MISRLDSLEFCPTNVLDLLNETDANFQTSNHSFFLIEWITKQKINFSQTKQIQNSYLPTNPIYSSKNGQELHQNAGIQLMNLLNNQNFEQPQTEELSNLDSPQSSLSLQSPQPASQIPYLDQKLPMMQQQQVTFNPVTLAYPPQPPFGMNNYMQQIPLKLFIYPLLLQSEKKRAWTKGAGGLADFLLKKMKKEMENGDNQSRSRSSSRKKDDRKRRSKSYDRQKSKRSRSRSFRDGRSKKKRDRRDSYDHSRSRSRDFKKKHKYRS